MFVWLERTSDGRVLVRTEHGEQRVLPWLLQFDEDAVLYCSPARLLWPWRGRWYASTGQHATELDVLLPLLLREPWRK